MATTWGPLVIYVERTSSGAGHRRRRCRRRISRRSPMAVRPAAKTSHGTRISRLAAVTVTSAPRRILSSLVSFPGHRVVAYGGGSRWVVCGGGPGLAWRVRGGNHGVDETGG